MTSLADIVDLWQRLQDAAAHGDREAREFLVAFSPWASQEMRELAS